MSGFPITITTGSGTPIDRPIIEQVKLGVATGTLAPGDAMPSVRSLAEQKLDDGLRPHSNPEPHRKPMNSAGSVTSMAHSVDHRGPAAAPRAAERLASLDAYRGFVILVMLTQLMALSFIRGSVKTHLGPDVFRVFGDVYEPFTGGGATVCALWLLTL